MSAIDWRWELPVLHGTLLTLREVTKSDAPSLLALMTSDDVARMISSPPPTIDGFERFIAYMQQQRADGLGACYAMVPNGGGPALGVFQIRSLEPTFRTAEWGFALGSEYWGRGLFVDGATQVLGFVFDTVGVDRLEARAAVQNGRGNGALRKLGAVEEMTLRRSFHCHGRYVDQVLWSIVAVDRRVPQPRIERMVRMH